MDKMRQNRTNSIQFLTTDELRRLIGVIDNPRDRAIFLLAYRHGLRASEVGLLQVSDIDFQRGRILLHRLKGSLNGEHPLQPDEVKALRTWLRRRKHESPILFTSNRGTAISRRMLDVLMKDYSAQAGLPPAKRHFHVLKHTICTHLLDASDNLRFVQDWAGHANIANTVVYAQLAGGSREAKAREAFRKLPRF
jgi:type 1 fimbriae regulatory protein FimB/type 1 fimbriae regulatory protein FimE